MMGRGFANEAGGRFGGYGRMGGGFARHGFFPGGGVIGLLFALIVIAIMVFAFWQLFRKAGYHGALSLLMLVPVVNVGMLLFLALSEWPAHKELKAWRTWYASTATPAAPVVAAVAEPVAAPVAAPAAAPVAETPVAEAPAAPEPPATPEPPAKGKAKK
jgi:hypothetical protein